MAGTGPAIVVVFPEPGSQAEIRVRRELKEARQEAGWSKAQAPIQRMYWSLPHHRKLLVGLQITPEQLPWIGLAWRDEAGWPVRMEQRLRVPAPQVVRAFEQRYLIKKGILLVLQDSEHELIRPFVRELGLLWYQQTGDFSGSELSLALVAPEKLNSLDADPPFAQVAEFRRGELAETFGGAESLQLPAQSVRKLWSRLQSRELGRPVEPPVQCEPWAEPSTFREVHITRAQELAKQLFDAGIRWSEVVNLSQDSGEFQSCYQSLRNRDTSELNRQQQDLVRRLQTALARTVGDRRPPDSR